MDDKKLEQAIIDAKKSLSDKELKETLERCSYGGKPIDMSLKGGDFRYGKACAGTVGEN